MLLLKVSKNKRSSSSSRRRCTKRKQQGAEQPKRKAPAKKDWSYPAGHHPQQTFINWRRKVSWELHLRRDSSRRKQMKSPERKFQRNYGRTQWRKRNSKRDNDGQLEKVSKAQGHLVRQRTVRTADQRVSVWEAEVKYKWTVHYRYAIPPHRYHYFQTNAKS